MIANVMTPAGIDGAKSVRVLVVDDYLPWRQFVCRALLARPTWQVIGQVSDGLEAVEKAEDLQPDLIVLDIGLPTINGIEAATRIRNAAPDSKILFLSENSSVEVAEEAFRRGAAGYVVKSKAGQELLPALDAILQGDRFVSLGLADHDLISFREGISGRRSHQIEFCTGDSSFVDAFATTIEAALRTGNAMVVIASESHLARIQQRLTSDGVDVDAAVERKSYLPLELTGSLSTVYGHVAGRSIGDAFSLIAEMVLAAKKEHFHVAVG
ncbi:MAG TPA: response regulator [Candidatus Angelobacter sp.]